MGKPLVKKDSLKLKKYLELFMSLEDLLSRTLEYFNIKESVPAVEYGMKMTPAKTKKQNKIAV
jgi:hypothetical protein